MPGASHPLGVTLVNGGANFSLFSRNATRVELLLFDRADDGRPSRIGNTSRQAIAEILANNVASINNLFVDRDGGFALADFSAHDP